MTASKNRLYDRALAILADYLGPAADRFIDRQIEGHLGKPPGRLNPGDIPVLVEWTRLALALLTEDKVAVDQMSQRLLKLAAKTTTSKAQAP